MIKGPKWTRALSVNVKEIDEQHKELLDIMCRSADMYNQGQIDLLPVLNELADYLQFHFQTEQKYMYETNYPDFLQHNKEHQFFTEKILGFLEDYDQNYPNLAKKMLVFMRDWYINHIKGTDLKMAAHLIREFSRQKQSREVDPIKQIVIAQRSYDKILDTLFEGLYFLDTTRTIRYWNKAAQRITGYKSSEVLGRQCKDNLLIHLSDDLAPLCQHSCPAAATMEDGKLREANLFLHHKNGHRVPVAVRVRPLRDDDGEIIGAVEIFSDRTANDAIRQRLKEVEKMAMVDPLTRLPNRRYLEKQMGVRFATLKRIDQPFGILIMDIDHFKAVNDNYGHNVGDDVLKMVANTLQKSSRPYDVVGRWGGEEFVAILANISPEYLEKIANRYRILVSQSKLMVENTPVSVTISIGCTMADSTDSMDSLVDKADQMLYHSKKTGRNRVSVADHKS